MNREETILKLIELLDLNKKTRLLVSQWVYEKYPELVKEKPEGITINISKLSDDILKNMLEIAETVPIEIPFYLTLNKPVQETS